MNFYYNLYSAKKMADFKTPGLGIGLEFEHNDIYEVNNFCEDSPDPKSDDQVIRVRVHILLLIVISYNIGQGTGEQWWSRAYVSSGSYRYGVRAACVSSQHLEVYYYIRVNSILHATNVTYI